jgi:hypothetical protein
MIIAAKLKDFILGNPIIFEIPENLKWFLFSVTVVYEVSNKEKQKTEIVLTKEDIWLFLICH